MSDGINRNENKISDIRTEIRQINKKFSSNQPTSISTGNNDRTGEHPPTMGPGRELSYNKSRRSVRVWPLAGECEAELHESFKKFAKDALKISP